MILQQSNHRVAAIGASNSVPGPEQNVGIKVYVGDMQVDPKADILCKSQLLMQISC